MRKWIFCLVMASFFQVHAAGLCRGEAIPIIDPHEEPAQCLSCHNREMRPDEEVSGEDILLADTIDDTCHICHPYDCCRINSLKGHNHPSNVSEWDVENFTEPDSLPLFDGMITCLTCHHHRKSEIKGRHYRMVRLVKVNLGGVDWTGLCLDCHKDY